MSRMYEPRLSEREPTLERAECKHKPALGREQLERLCERRRLQLVNCMNAPVLANRPFSSGNHSPMNALHGLPRSNLQPAPLPYSKLSEPRNGFGDFKYLALSESIASEEPLLIQCGENTAHMFLSKLCQGSKGPCILFQNEWLTPNELQFISGRETAKDWKRSIRYKGRSLKSLISRGLIRVHPPICDCRGCRISLPLNRIRLTEKCGLPVTSMMKTPRDRSTSVSSWRDEQIHNYRHGSYPDFKHSMGGPSPDTSVEEHESISSECSDTSAGERASCYEGHDRPRSLTPVGSRKRRSSDSSSLFCQAQEKYFNSIRRNFSKRHSADPCVQKAPGAVISTEKDTCNQTYSQSDTIVKTESTSAFHTVRKEHPMTLEYPEAAGDSLTYSPTETLQKEGLTRTCKTRGSTSRRTSFSSQNSQCLTPSTLLCTGRTSPRLLAEPYLLASHSSRMYQRAGIQSQQQSYMHYALMAPTHQNKLQTVQSSTLSCDPDTHASVESLPWQSPPTKESISNDKEAGREERGHKIEGSLSEKAYSEARVPLSEISDQECADHKSEASSSSLSSLDNPDFRSSLHKRVPRLHVDLSDNVLSWNTDDVCHFVLSITRSVETSQAFKEENIDGHSLVLIREEHLLDKMSVKLGPALKVLAQINKLVENMEIDKESNPS